MVGLLIYCDKMIDPMSDSTGLRVLSECIILQGSAIFGATFNLVRSVVLT